MSKKLFLVEDNEGDVVMITEALEDSHLDLDLTVARDGEQAIEMLKQCIDQGPDAYPDFILLDINLPKLNGHEVLSWIKISEALKHIPVIMLTTSSSNRDVMSAYRHHANSYISKPMLSTDYNKVIQALEEYWTRISHLPKEL